MRIIIAGYGFYALGNKHLQGGTIVPAMLAWLDENPDQFVDLSIIVRSLESKKIADQRVNVFLAGFENKQLVSRIKIETITYEKIDRELQYDCGIVAVPEKAHVDVISILSKVVSKIICVKPLGSDNSDLEKILKIQENSKCPIFIDFHKRYDESNISFINAVSHSNFNNAIFKFSYGQKSEMPLAYFRKWAKSSNPFQYLAPHYLDIIFSCLRRSAFNVDSFDIKGKSLSRSFSTSPDIISLVSSNLEFRSGDKSVLVSADCNWMEPAMMPYSSRQRIEFLAEDMHIISEQDDRGQMHCYADSISIPNPHFMVRDSIFGVDGYGKRSFTNFLNYVCGRYNVNHLAKAVEFRPISKVIEFVNEDIY